MFTAREIAELIGGTLDGDGDIPLKGIATLDTAGREDLSFLTNLRYEKSACNSEAPVILAGEKADIPGKTLIRHQDPYWSLSRLIPLFRPLPKPPPGIAPSAEVDPDATIDPSAAVLASSVIGAGVRIGTDVVIHPGVVILGPSVIGDGSTIYPNVTIYPRVTLGSRVIIQSGAVIGSDGFGFAPHEGCYHKIPQMGGVVLEDDVEIGANTAVDAGTLTPTVIGEGSKIDNLAQIAHNVRIGKHSVLVGMVGISGSTQIGDHCVFAGQSGAVGHIKIGNKVTVTAKTGVTKDVADGKTVSGFPSRDHRMWLKEQAALLRLPSLLKKLKGASDGTED